MSVVIEFEVPGKPHAQGRQRGMRRGPGIHFYDAPASRIWKEGAAKIMLAARGRRRALEGPVAVEIEAVFVRSVRSATRSWCAVRNGDADNIAKAVLDAGNKVLWADDAQVCSLFVTRQWGSRDDSPHIRVRVTSLDQGGK